MAETKSIHSAAIDLVDESFDPKRSGEYHLSILAGEKYFAFSALDITTNKYVLLHKQPIAFPKFETLEKLGTAFKSVTCAIAHPKFTLVPASLFNEDNKESLLGFNHSVENGEKIHSDVLRNLEARNLFTISREFESGMRKQFPNVHFLHSATSLIEGLLIRNKNNAGKKVFANFYPNHFEIVILGGRDLLFSNAFSYKAAEDIAYYILFIYEQLHLNPEVIELVLSGEIEKTSSEHSLLYNYIRHVKFADRPDELQYSYKFEEVPAHTFFSLFTQYLCV